MSNMSIYEQLKSCLVLEYIDNSHYDNYMNLYIFHEEVLQYSFLENGCVKTASSKDLIEYIYTEEFPVIKLPLSNKSIDEQQFVDCLIMAFKFVTQAKPSDISSAHKILVHSKFNFNNLDEETKKYFVNIHDTDNRLVVVDWIDADEIYLFSEPTYIGQLFWSDSKYGMFVTSDAIKKYTLK